MARDDLKRPMTGGTGPNATGAVPSGPGFEWAAGAGGGGTGAVPSGPGYEWAAPAPRVTTVGGPYAKVPTPGPYAKAPMPEAPTPSRAFEYPGKAPGLRAPTGLQDSVARGLDMLREHAPEIADAAGMALRRASGALGDLAERRAHIQPMPQPDGGLGAFVARAGNPEERVKAMLTRRAARRARR